MKQQFQERSHITGLYFKDLNKIKIAPKQDHEELVLCAQTGCTKSKETIIKSYLQLVVSIASKYREVCEFDDLISEGNIGLIKAIDKYKQGQGVLFGSYCHYWIKAYIFDYISTYNNTIEIPVSQARKMKEFLKERENFFKENGYYPGITTSEEQIPFLYRIEESSHDEVEDNFIDRFEDSDSLNSLNSFSDKEFVDKLLKVLNEQELTIIKHSFGLDGAIQYTPKHVAKMLGITEAKGRQLKAIALRKMKFVFKTSII